MKRYSISDLKRVYQQNKVLVWLLLAISAAVLAMFLWLVFNAIAGEKNAPVKAPFAQKTDRQIFRDDPPIKVPPEQTIAPQPEATLPALVEAPVQLDDSDTSVLEAIAAIGPDIGQWLLPDQQIRKWVLAVDLIADGKLPRRYRPIDYPMTAFKAQKSEGKLIADPANQQRYDELISALETLDTTLLARYYRAWLPLLESAYSEQGKPDSFSERFQQAISRLIAVDDLPLADENDGDSGGPQLKRPKVMYIYADESLEQASDVEKLLWRMGDENRNKLQFFLRDLRYKIDL